MKIRYIAQAFIASLFVMGATSCEDIFETDTKKYLFEEDNSLSTASDSLYSAIGIVSQLQSLGERYVLLGELRGDLVTVPATAPFSLQEISNFNISAENTYSSRRDYYNVINNCNFAISRMDTAIVEGTTHVMMREYAAIRTIRAWVYWQMALTYGSVNYVDQPILTLEDSEKDYPVVSIDELATRLIDDLLPYAGIEVPTYGSIDGMQSSRFFIPARMLLGDLYLYLNNYAMAAQMYYELIYQQRLIVNMSYANQWVSSVQAAATTGNRNSYRDEIIAGIPYASDAKKYHPNLVNMTYSTQPYFTPASWYVAEMNLKKHYHIDRVGINTISGYLEGDVRGQFLFRDGITEESSAFGNFRTGVTSEDLMISKFYHNAYEYTDVTNPDNEMFDELGTRILRDVALYRVPHVYLRYAEAVNRAGKPSLAFAALKYGLRYDVVHDTTVTYVARHEIETAEPWIDFSDSRFDDSYGMAMRGRGLGIAIDRNDYIIPDFTRYVDGVDSLGNTVQLPSEAIVDIEAARQDSILWVEDCIVEEMAAETMFEGNRFFDLLRVSRHRNDPQYLAGKVAARFDDPDAAREILKNEENWWIK